MSKKSRNTEYINTLKPQNYHPLDKDALTLLIFIKTWFALGSSG